MVEFPSDEQVEWFIDAFFGPPNQIALGDVTLREDRQEWLDSWVDDLRDPSHPPVVLPFRGASDQTTWVALAFTADDLQELRTGILSFLGPTYSDYTGLSEPHPMPAVHELLTVFVGGRYFTFETPQDAASQAVVRSSLDLMRLVRQFRPQSQRRYPRPTGRILRDFYWAIRDHDLEHSQDLLDELAVTGQVTSLNIVYLQIQRMSTLGLWRELLGLAGLGDAVNTRRPVLVTQAIARAIAEVHFSVVNQPPDSAGAIGAFDQHVADTFWSFFKDRGETKDEPTILLHTLWAITQGAHEPVLRELASLPVGAESKWGPLIEALRRDWPAEEQARLPADPVAGVQQAIEQGAYVQAIELIERTTPSHKFATLAVGAAYEADTVETAQRAIRYLELLSDEGRDALPPTRQFNQMLEFVEAKAGAPTSWVQWFSRLDEERAVSEDAENGVALWNPDDLAYQGQSVSQAIDSLERSATTTFRDALPHILNALDSISPNAPTSGSALIRDSILLQLAVAESLSTGELELVVELIEGILDTGPDASRYCDLVDVLESIITRESSYRRTDIMTDLVSLIASFPIRDPDCALRVAVTVAESLAPFIDRISEIQFSLLDQSTAVLGYPLPRAREVPDSEETIELDPLDQLKTMRVGIYTLARGVGTRAKRYLESCYPGIDVETSDAHESNEELVAMARGCDVVIVAWKASKHAATDAIKSNRPKGQPIVQAAGKGHSSIVTALYEHMA